MAKAKDSPQQRRMKDRDVDMLYHGMMKHGTNFQAIIEDREFYLLADFTPTILHSRYSNLVTKKDARFYRLRETLVSSQSAMSSPRSTPRPRTPVLQKPRESDTPVSRLSPETHISKGTPVSRGKSMSRTPSALSTTAFAAASSPSNQSNDRVIEVIDVEPAEGRGGLFNVKLGNKKHSWISREQFGPRDTLALSRYIKGLKVKLTTAMSAYELVTNKQKIDEQSSDSEDSQSEDSGSGGGEEEEDTLMDGIVSDEDESESDESEESEADDYNKTNGKKTMRVVRPFEEEDDSVDGSKEDSVSETESEASEAGTVDLEEKPAPLQYSDEPEPADTTVDGPLQVVEPEDALMDSEDELVESEEEELPSPEECFEDVFMTQAQTQVSEANAQKNFPTEPAPVRLVEPNPFLLPISIETHQETRPEDENVMPAQAVAFKRPATDADDELARKKKRIIESMEAARSNPVADDKCIIM